MSRDIEAERAAVWKTSTLPEWAEPERYHFQIDGLSIDLIKIVCPYTTGPAQADNRASARCGRPAWVEGNWLTFDRNRANGRTRQCSYCGRSAWLPGQHPGHPPEGEPHPASFTATKAQRKAGVREPEPEKPKRIVKRKKSK